MASRNGIYPALVLAEIEKFWASTLPHKMCPRKQTTKPKLLILVFFSGEVTSYTDTSYCIHILWEVSHSIFFWATLYIKCKCQQDDPRRKTGTFIFNPYYENENLEQMGPNLEVLSKFDESSSDGQRNRFQSIWIKVFELGPEKLCIFVCILKAYVAWGTMSFYGTVISPFNAGCSCRYTFYEQSAHWLAEMLCT